MPQNPYICVSFNCPFVTAEVNSFYGAEPKFFLGGGSKHFVIFIPIWGEMIQFDQHIFQMGWFNHQPDLLCETIIAHDEFGSRCLELLRWCSIKMDRNMYKCSKYTCSFFSVFVVLMCFCSLANMECTCQIYKGDGLGVERVAMFPYFIGFLRGGVQGKGVTGEP